MGSTHSPSTNKKTKLFTKCSDVMILSGEEAQSMVNVIGTSKHVLEVCEHALAMAGYKVLDGDDESIFVRHKENYFEVKVEDCTGTL